MEEIWRVRTLKEWQRFEADYSNGMGFRAEDGGWIDKRQGALGSRGLPGPRPSGWPFGDFGVRRSEIPPPLGGFVLRN